MWVELGSSCRCRSLAVGAGSSLLLSLVLVLVLVFIARAVDASLEIVGLGTVAASGNSKKLYNSTHLKCLWCCNKPVKYAIYTEELDG